ncbi:hypothetical protein ACLBSQ_33370, partial [Klebsiella pneumoniae]
LICMIIILNNHNPNIRVNILQIKPLTIIAFCLIVLAAARNIIEVNNPLNAIKNGTKNNNTRAT